MKYTLLLFILIPSLAFGQKLSVNEIDKFTKDHRLQTSNIRLKTGMLAYIRTVSHADPKSTSYFIKLFGSTPAPDVIGENDRLLFLLDNDSTVTGYSTGFQSYQISPKMYYHQYRITESDLRSLSSHNLKSIRKYGSGGYSDVEIPERNQGELKDAAAIILKELNQ